jgi:hypothetical protein
MAIFWKAGRPADFGVQISALLDEPYRATMSSGELEAAHSAGHSLIRQGRIGEARAILEQDSRMGNPGSLATLTWHLLLAGEHAPAIDVFDASYDDCEALTEAVMEAQPNTFISGQFLINIINARSNVALHRLAVGGDPSVALETWAEMTEYGHPESIFYPAVLRYRQGDIAGAQAQVQAMTDAVLKEMDQTLTELVTHGTGWIVDFARDGQALLTKMLGSGGQDQARHRG